MRCHRHPGSRVQSRGTYEAAGGTRRKYVCVPAGGRRHSFVVAEGAPARAWTPPPPCPTHPSGAVVRNGTYGVRTPRPRQRYRCTPGDGSAPHSFTPALAREHVHSDERGCVECEELRGVHHGETAVARRHSWPTRLVARALNELSSGGSYADVSRQALRAAERTAARHEALVGSGLTAEQADAVVGAEEDAADQGTPPPPLAAVLGGAGRTGFETSVAARQDRQRYRRRRRRTKRSPTAAGSSDETETQSGDTTADAPLEDQRAGTRTKNARSAESHNVWHIAADWTEAFSPVIFDPIDRRLREQALTERARLDALRAEGRPLDRPQVLLLDDVPVYGRDRGGSGKSRRDDGFFLLVAAEVQWGTTPEHPADLPDRRLRLRLVRAMPKSNAPAWRLLLDELGYHPDFVVADAGTGIGRAVADHFDPARTVFVPSLWHVATAVKTGLADTCGALVAVPGGGRAPIPELRAHLAGLGRDDAISSTTAWTTWWDTLETICVAKGLPLDRVRRRRRNYEQPFATAIAALAAHPGVPVSTGGLETLVAKQVQPLLAMRRTGFGNIERTNRLFDLVVAREHGAFDDLTDVVALLRADATRHDGWTAPLRDISDPRPDRGRYSSLRDTLLITEIAESRGLA